MAGMQTDTTVVFVPGFMQPADAWQAVAERLPQRYPSVLLGHHEHTYEGRLREIAGAGSGAVLCGYSLGGRLALHASLRDPSAYAALVTVGVSAGIEAPGARAARAEADEKLASWVETQPIESIVDIWERQPLFADQSAVLVAAQRPGRLTQDPRDLALILRTAGQGALEPQWQRLYTLSLPVLTVAGVLDQSYVKAAERMAGAVPVGSAAVIEHAGHAAHLQRPVQFTAALVDFLDEHLGQGVV